ncbi:MAG: DUF1569 domain-containing protein [Bacteroidota bacterium]
MLRKALVVVALLVVGLYFYSKAKMNISNEDFLDPYLDEIEQKIQFRDELNPKVSQVAVAWHLDHMLKTINGISDSLVASDPTTFENGLKPIGRLSLTLNFIPRGQAESPASVRPPDVIKTEDIEHQLAQAREKIKIAFAQEEDAHFHHPVFGTINKNPSLRFIEVHTEHHLKIIRDILEE